MDYGKEKRKDLDTQFNDNQKKLDDLGQFQTNNKKPNTIADMNAQRKILEIQKQQRQIIEIKQKDNQNRGRTHNDGEDY